MGGIWNQIERIGKRKPWDQDQYFSVLWGSAHANFVRSNLVLFFWIRDPNVWYKTLESTTKQYASLQPCHGKVSTGLITQSPRQVEICTNSVMSMIVAHISTIANKSCGLRAIYPVKFDIPICLLTDTDIV